MTTGRRLSLSWSKRSGSFWMCSQWTSSSQCLLEPVGIQNCSPTLPLLNWSLSFVNSCRWFQVYFTVRESWTIPTHTKPLALRRAKTIPRFHPPSTLWSEIHRTDFMWPILFHCSCISVTHNLWTMSRLKLYLQKFLHWSPGFPASQNVALYKNRARLEWWWTWEDEAEGLPDPGQLEEISKILSLKTKQQQQTKPCMRKRRQKGGGGEGLW